MSPSRSRYRQVQPQRRGDDPGRARSVVVEFNNVSPSSIVLATLQQLVSNVLVAGVVVGTGKFTIVLNKATPSPVKVGWFVIG